MFLDAKLGFTNKKFRSENFFSVFNKKYELSPIKVWVSNEKMCVFYS